VVFSDEALARKIDEQFVCTWLNKHPEVKFAPGIYDRFTPAVFARFPVGTAPDNVCAVFLRDDGTLLSAVPGYLDRKAFTEEMELATKLAARLASRETWLRGEAGLVFEQAHADRAARLGSTVAGKAHMMLAKLGLGGIERLPADAFDALAPRER
jgi:hypothetical protein